MVALPSPAVSVLLPVRNAARWLPDAIDSLGAQTFPDFEVIAVDDGSSDGSGAILEAWAAADPRVRVIASPPRGIVPTLEAARAEARGRWLARMDADDVALPRRLERQAALMAVRPELAGCGTGVRYFPRAAVREGARRYERWINALVEPDEIERDLFVECPIPHPTFFLRADAVDAVGGWCDRGWPEDYDLVLRLWEAGGSFAKVPEILLEWRERPDRLSRTHPAYSSEAFRRCKVHFLDRSLRKGRDVVIWGAGPTGKAFARALAAAGIRLRAFVELDPRKIGKRIHGAPVVSPDAIDGLRGAFCVAAVGQAGGREEIRAALSAAGWRELEEYVAVA
ncbi:MAG TPA: glycosyltransferase family A protein [Gemmatimonadota bacterium]|nr:glycosyltransferase family A protein [Gemmatimonadota bacterium]